MFNTGLSIERPRYRMKDLYNPEEPVYFKDIGEMIGFLANGQRSSLLYSESDYGNKYLDSINMTGSCREWDVSSLKDKYSNGVFILKRYTFYNNITEEIVDVRKHARSVASRAKRDALERRIALVPDYKFRVGPVPGTGVRRSRVNLRLVQTTNEKRFASIKEHQPYIRPKRRGDILPSSWDDIWVRTRRDWKAKTVQSKQWAKNFKERTTVPDRYDNEFFRVEEDIDSLLEEDFERQFKSMV